MGRAGASRAFNQLGLMAFMMEAAGFSAANHFSAWDSMKHCNAEVGNINWPPIKIGPGQPTPPYLVRLGHIWNRPFFLVREEVRLKPRLAKLLLIDSSRYGQGLSEVLD